MMGYGYGGWRSTGWMMAADAVFWLVLIVVAALLIGRAMHRTGVSHFARRSPGLDILEERYARGEIEREEYLQKKKDMVGGGS